MADLSAMLKSGPVMCAEGYLFECERRGYLQAGAFVPEVVLDDPGVLAEVPLGHANPPQRLNLNSVRNPLPSMRPPS